MITTCPRRPFEGGSRHERNIDEVGDSAPIRVYVGHGHGPGPDAKVAHLALRQNIPAAMLRRVGPRKSNGAAEPEQPRKTMGGAANPDRGKVGAALAWPVACAGIAICTATRFCRAPVTDRHGRHHPTTPPPPFCSDGYSIKLVVSSGVRLRPNRSSRSIPRRTIKGIRLVHLLGEHRR